MQTVDYLKIALNEAKSRRGFCAPNPSVGACVVKDNQILALGRHYAAGSVHAEIDALQQLDEVATEGATLYVTLEPCCHHGRTPPCTQAIIERKLSKVYYGFADPNPQVAGKGAALLKQAGVVCERIEVAEINQFYQSYQYWWQHKKPFVTAKIALSLDGKIAGPNGESVAITGEACRQLTHRQRLQHDAILTTSRTVNADDPQLNVRLENTIIGKPIYVLDRQLILNPKAKIFTTGQSITIFHSENADKSKQSLLQQLGATLITIKEEQQTLSLEQVVAEIGKQGIQDLWVEAGGQCFYALFQQGLLQHAYVYVSPTKLGPEAQQAFPKSFDITSIGADIETSQCGEDIVFSLRLC